MAGLRIIDTDHSAKFGFQLNKIVYIPLHHLGHHCTKRFYWVYCIFSSCIPRSTQLSELLPSSSLPSSFLSHLFLHLPFPSPLPTFPFSRFSTGGLKILTPSLYRATQLCPFFPFLVHIYSLSECGFTQEPAKDRPCLDVKLEFKTLLYICTGTDSNKSSVNRTQELFLIYIFYM